MSDPVNLNRVRKLRRRAKDKERADENTVRFGRSKAERNAAADRDAKARAALDAHRIDDPET